MEIWIPVISVIISVFASVVITTYQSRIEVAKLKKQLEQQYAKSLFDRRLEAYPKLYKILSGYTKVLLHKQQTIENLTKFRDDLDEWDSENSLLLTDWSARLAGKFRHYLDGVILKSKETKIEDNEFRDIWSIIAWYEQTIRTEIGILDTIPPGEMKEKLNEVYNFIDEKRGALKSDSEQKRELPPPWRKK